MPGYIDPKFRDGPPDEPKATWAETLGTILGAIVVCILIGAAALFYLFTEMLPSLSH